MENNEKQIKEVIVEVETTSEVIVEPEIVVEEIAEPRPVGRPSDYTQDLADIICEELARGVSLRTICLSEDMPDARSVFRWLRTNKEFCQQYTRAKEESADADLETIEELGDIAIQEAKDADPKSSNAIVNAYKIKADNLKWGMSKKKPKKYGDKLDMTSDGKAFPAPIYNGRATE